MGANGAIGDQMNRLFRGGVPYAIDVKKLNEAFPVPSLSEGRVIKHSELEAILNQTKGSQRYYGVTNSFIAQMKNTNGIFIIWEPSVGIRVLGPAELLGHAEIRTRQKIGQTDRAIRNFNWVDRTRLDTTGQQRLDHQLRVASVVRDALNAAKK